MTAEARAGTSPFSVRSYRFQWPADLAASWAFEMETLILGWYVLVETGSVLLFTLFASLAYVGNLVAPMFGVAGHRIGNKRLLAGMRATYMVLATLLMTLAFLKLVSPLYVFIIAGLMGLVRPSDLVMRYALIGETMPATHILSATSISRTTQDSARITGALTGAGMVAWLGMGPAYLAIACLYATSFMLTLRVTTPVRPPAASEMTARSSAWRDLKEGVLYIWRTPQLLAAMYMAFLINVTAFPLVNALMPYVAKEVYHTDQTGLGYLVSGFGLGALIGAILLSRYGRVVRAGRTMLVFCAAWYFMVLIFAQMDRLEAGVAMLVVTGCAQSLSTVPMSAMLLRNSAEHLRSRVMGIRMLAVYGVPIGLLISGPLLARYGYRVTATVYCIAGLLILLFIALHWREHLWHREAPANRR